MALAHRYGDIGISDRLKRARIVAGFASSRTAAQRFNWRLGTYLGHESGTRKIPEELLETYARAFDCPTEWLRTGNVPRNGRYARFAKIAQQPLDELMADVRANAPVADSPEISGKRLANVRLAAGFSTPGAAAHYFGFRRTTLAAYETGKARISLAMAAVYGYAYGVDPTWLRTGHPPSGLAGADDLSTEQFAVALVDGNVPKIAASQLGDPAVVKAMDEMEARRLQHRSPNPEVSLRIPEWKQASREGSRLGDWTIPVDLVAHLEPRRRDSLVIVTVSAILGYPTRVQAGDRVAMEIGRKPAAGDTAVFLDQTQQTFVIADHRETKLLPVGTAALHLGGAI